MEVMKSLSLERGYGGGNKQFRLLLANLRKVGYLAASGNLLCGCGTPRGASVDLCN